MKAKVAAIAAHGITCFVNRQLIYNYPESLLAEHGIMSIEHADFEGVERLALVTGGEIASTFDAPEKVKIGRCDVIEEIMIGEDKVRSRRLSLFVFIALFPFPFSFLSLQLLHSPTSESEKELIIIDPPKNTAHQVLRSGSRSSLYRCPSRSYVPNGRRSRKIFTRRFERSFPNRQGYSSHTWRWMR